MLRSSLCDLRDAYIVVKGTITVGNTAVAGKEANKQITLDLKTENQCENCFIVTTSVVAQAKTFSIIDRKFYVPVITLSTQHNAKLLEQLKSSFKRTNNWIKYRRKVSTE